MIRRCRENRVVLPPHTHPHFTIKSSLNEALLGRVWGHLRLLDFLRALRHQCWYMKIEAPTGYEVSKAVQAVPAQIRYCLYARKSTESEERQVLSIDSQIKEMLQLAEREGLEVVAMKRESHSAKETGQRPVFNEIIEEIKQEKFNAILSCVFDYFHVIESHYLLRQVS